RLDREAGTQVHRTLGLEILRAQEACLGRRDGEGADVERRAIDEVRRCRGEEFLTERRGAEATADGAAQREAISDLISRRDLAVRRRTEVGVMLEAAGDVDEQLRREIALDVGVE